MDESQAFRPDLVSFNATLSALASARRWQQCCHMLALMNSLFVLQPPGGCGGHRCQVSRKILIKSIKNIYRIIFFTETFFISYSLWDETHWIPSRVGGRSSGPLVLWFFLQTAGPLVRWSLGPLVLRGFDMEGHVFFFFRGFWLLWLLAFGFRGFCGF